MKKLALLLATVVAFAVTANAAVTSVTWNSVNGGTNATRTYSVNAGSAITNITATTAGAALTASPGGCGITPTLPAGMTWTQTSTTVCTIAGTPTNPSPTKTYFINFRSTGAPTDSLSFITLTVGPITNLNYQKYARLTKGVAINTITPSITGTPTTYSIAGTGVTDAATFNTATGLTFNTTTGAISGTPNTTLALTKFTINATDGTFNTGGGTAGLVDSVKLVIVDTAAYSSWSYYEDITVTPTGIGGNVTNYPLLVKLTSSNFDFTQSRSTIGSLAGSAISGGGGADLRFTLTDGKSDLPYQIERWDSAGQKAEIWVNVPVVASSGSTVIRMHWGKTGQTTTSSGPNTFIKEDNVQGTWHFNANGTGNEADATANGFTATAGGTVPTNNTSSLIGLGRTFGGAGYLKLSSPSTASSVLSFAQSSAYTISSWVNPNTTPTTARVIVGKSNQQYAIGLSGNNPNGLTGQHYEGVEFTVVPNATAAATLSSFWPHAFSPVTYSVWTNVVMVQNNGARSVYVNGALANFNASQPRGYLFDRQGTSARQVDRDVIFGAEASTAPSTGTFSKFFSGTMDEISMHTVARDTNWIKLNFQTQCSAGLPASCPSSPMAYGSTTLNPPQGLSYTSGTPIYKVGLPVTNSPTLTAGVATSYSITPDLNANTGLTFNTTRGVISGSATQTAVSTAYLITATNSAGSDTETVTITVNQPDAPNLSWAGSPYALTVGRTAGTITPSNASDAPASCSSAPTLPAGLSLSADCVITGTPTASSASTDYTITATNAGGPNDSHVFIAVADTTPLFTSQPAAKTALIGASGVKFGASVILGGPATVDYKWVRTKSGANGGAVDTIQVTSNTSALTDTLTLAADSVVATADSSSYKVVVSNSVGAVTSNAVLLRITPTVSYSPSTLGLGKVSTTITPTTTGTITTCSSSPTLPAGLSIAATTCVITGTPTLGSASTNYSITPVGPGATGTAFVLNLAVVNAPRIMNYTSDSTARIEQDVAIPSFLPVVLDSFVAPLTYAVTSGSLPDGLLLNANTGAITGTPTSEGSYTPIISATNAAGSVARTINFTVYAPESYTGSSADFKFNTARAGVNGALSNFPILVRLNNSHRTIFQNTDSSAIRFTNAAGTHLPYQIENWKTDPSDTSAAIWVKLPSVAANDTTIVRMYWGQSVDGGRSEGGLVFPRSNGYQAVWHMNNGGTGNELDASNNGFTATATNAAVDTVGAMGRARKFNGSSNYFTVANSAKGQLDFRVTDSYTLSTWSRSNTITTATGTGHGFVNKGDNQYSLAIYGSAASPKYYEHTIKANNTWNQITSSPAGANVGAWRLITGTWTGPAAVGGSGIDSLYVDGQFVAATTISAVNTGRSETFNVHIGALGGGTAPGSSASRFMDGSLDEIRLSNVARSANWIKMEYKNQKPGVTPVANLTYSDNAPTYLRTITITANTPSLLGTATRYEATGLPSGLSINANTGAITGSASADGDYNVTVTAYGDSSWSTAKAFTMSVIPPGPTFTYSTPQSYLFGAAISTLSPNHTGGTATTWTIDPALPTGLSFNTSNGAITGTPAAVIPATDFTIIGSSVNGADTAVVNITVYSLPPVISYSSPQSYLFGQAISALNPSNSGAAATNWSISPALPSGLSLSTSTGSITGTPSAVSAATEYTVIAVAAGGASDTALVTIDTYSLPPVISYTGSPLTYNFGSAISTLSPSNSGAASTNWSISPALPSGLSLSTSTGSITGTPSAVSAATEYTVIAVAAGGASDTAVISIATPAVVPSAPTGLAVAPSSGKIYVDWIASTFNGGATITGYTATATPGGATCTWTSGPMTCQIMGLSNGTEYTLSVVATNSVGNSADSSSAIATPGPAPLVSYPGSPFTFPMGSAVNENKVNSSLPANRWTISPNLNANTGLLFNPYTGRILGTPVYVTSATTYQIVAMDSVTGTSDRLTISIATAAVAPNISYATPQSYGLASAITQLSPSNSGGTVSSWAISPNLAANTGLGFSTVTGKISGTPVYMSSATDYTVIATGFGGTADTAIVNIGTFSTPPNISYTGSPFNFEVPIAISTVTPTNSGSVALSWSISPNLTANTGLAFSTTMGKISGTPVYSSAVTNYTIIATAVGGATDTAVVNIGTFSAPPTVSYDNTPLNYLLNVAITPLSKTGTTGPISGYSISPTLPNGLTFSTITGRIDGTPRVVTAATDYVITATGPGGTGKDTVNIQTSTPAPTVSYDNTPLNYTFRSAITTLTKTGTTGIITGYSISPALPAGLSFSTVTGAISGTPTALSAAADYEITATGPGGTGKDTVNIAVTTPAPTVSYSNSPVNFTLNVGTTTVTKTGTTGLISSYSISPALSAGLVFSTVTGAIGGTPSALSSAADYVITATGPGGTGKDTVNIAVTTPVPTVSYSNSPVNFTLNVGTTTVTKTSASGIISGYSISPALSAGLVFSTVTGAIGGTPSALSSAADYVITATGPGGTGKDTVNIAVTTPVPTVSYANTPNDFALRSVVSFTKTGTTGLISGYSISPALPAGLVFSTVTGAIGGTPTALSAAADYEITATGPGGSGKDTVNIAVTTPVPTVSYSNSPVNFTLKVAATTVTKTSASGIISGYSISPTLPAGLVFSTVTGAIGGTPSVLSAAADYVVTATGPGGSGMDTLNIAVTTPAPTVSYTNTPMAYPVGVVISTLAKTGVTGIISSYAISPTLPTGLTFSTTTGKIDGNPSVVTAASDYVITVTGPGGTGKDTVSIATTANPPVLSFAASPYSFVKNAAISSLKADNAGGPITSWSISNGSNGSSLNANTGLTFNPTTGKIQGTPVYVSAARTYVVTANGLASSSDTETVSIAVTLVAKLGGESAFTFRVTGGAMGYNLHMPKVDANTENVTVTISDLSGRKVWSQSVDPREGMRELAWDGRDQNGHLVSGGMYMVRISATGEGKTSTVTSKTVTLDH